MKRSHRSYLAFDLGASSGRAMLGTLQHDRLTLREISRFPNGPVSLGGSLYWDVLALWSNMLGALRACAGRGDRLSGIGVDTWGVDFGLIGRDGQLLANPVCYRDAHTEGIERVMARGFSRRAFYAMCGMDFGRVSTLAHLLAMKRGAGRDLLESASCLLLTPDLLRYFLCGERAAELTIAGSSLLTDIHRRAWSRRIIDAYGLPPRLFLPLARAGRFAGALRPEVAADTGAGPVPVAIVAGHDTTSAAAAAPLAGDGTVFLSSGTWSTIGLALPDPIATEAARVRGFVNEIGFDTVLFLKNLSGLYLAENLKRQWAKRGRAVSYADMIQAASKATPFKFVVDMNAPLFFSTDDVQTAVQSFLRATGQRGTPTAGELVRTLLESLAFSYRLAVSDAAEITGRALDEICLVGGGVRNELLSQWTADATGLRVSAGPVEATVAGNVGIQAMAAGEIKDLRALKRLVAESFPARRFAPRNTEAWAAHFERYQEVRKHKQ